MQSGVEERLASGVIVDPGLYGNIRPWRQAVRSDIGAPSPLSPGDTQNVRHVFVPHAHMDYFQVLTDGCARIRTIFPDDYE